MTKVSKIYRYTKVAFFSKKRKNAIRIRGRIVGDKLEYFAGNGVNDGCKFILFANPFSQFNAILNRSERENAKRSFCRVSAQTFSAFDHVQYFRISRKRARPRWLSHTTSIIIMYYPDLWRPGPGPETEVTTPR